MTATSVIARQARRIERLLRAARERPAYSRGLVVLAGALLLATVLGSSWLSTQRGWERTLYRQHEGEWAAIDTSFVRYPWVANMGELWQREFAVDWASDLFVSRGGTYEIEAAADDSLVVRIDGQTVLERNPAAGMGAVRTVIRLDRGRHRITARYEQMGGEKHVRVRWTRLAPEAGRLFFVTETFRPGPAATLRQALPWMPTLAIAGMVLALILTPAGHTRRIALVTVAVGAGLRLWLTGIQARTYWAVAIADDELYTRLAASLAKGNWLGPFDGLTLAKAPGYSLWVAASHYLPGSLRFAEELLYCLACVAIGVALRPALTHRLRALVILGLLWLPLTLAPERLRMVRESIYAALAILLTAAIVGLVLRAREGLARRAGWATAAGLAAGAIWITREESVWVLPMTIGALALLASPKVDPDRDRSERLLRALSTIVIALVFFQATVLTVRYMNFDRYGVAIVHDRPELSAPVGALARIVAGPADPKIPVSRDALEEAYAASPTLATIRSELERQVGGFSQIGDAWLGPDPRYRDEVPGTWFMWALRLAVKDAGLYPDSATAVRFYAQVVSEINEACRKQALSCTPEHSSVAPRPRVADIPGTASAGLRGLALLVRQPLPRTLLARPSVASAANISWLEAFTHDVVAAPAGRGYARPAAWRHDALRVAGHAGHAGQAGFLALIVAVLTTAWVQRRSPRGGGVLIGLSVCVLAAVGARLAILAYVDQRMFPAIHTLYLLPAAPLLFIAVALAATSRFARPVKSRRPLVPGSDPGS